MRKQKREIKSIDLPIGAYNETYKVDIWLVFRFNVI